MKLLVYCVPKKRLSNNDLFDVAIHKDLAAHVKGVAPIQTLCKENLAHIFKSQLTRIPCIPTESALDSAAFVVSHHPSVAVTPAVQCAHHRRTSHVQLHRSVTTCCGRSGCNHPKPIRTSHSDTLRVGFMFCSPNYARKPVPGDLH